MNRPTPRLTDRPFATLRGRQDPRVTVVTQDQLAAQRAAILAMHRAAKRAQRTERAVYGITFDTEGRAHDVHTGRYTSRPR